MNEMFLFCIIRVSRIIEKEITSSKCVDKHRSQSRIFTSLVRSEDEDQTRGGAGQICNYGDCVTAGGPIE
jgi:hypothetical protein